MKYKVVYLDSGQPITDGCTVIGSDGKDFTYDEVNHSNWKETLRAAEIFIVKSEFNVDVVVGKPAPAALKWLKPGMELKAVGCEFWYYSDSDKKYHGKVSANQIGETPNDPKLQQVIRITCEMCNHLH